jgi:hypothetical protein
VRLDVGARGDLFRFALADRLAGHDAARASRARRHGIVSPKGNLAIDLTGATTLFVNAGTGFHSNDARGVVAAGRGDRVLPRAVGGELGVRHGWDGGSAALALWALDLEDELVYVGDEGGTEPGGRTRRAGADLEVRARLAPWLWLDGDLNVARGRFRDAPAGERRIPLAPALTATTGLTARDLPAVSGGRAEGGVRMRHVGARAATADGGIRARGHTLWELFARWDAERVGVVLVVDNLLGTWWNEAQFATTSRLRGEPAPVSELHFTAGAPRTVQLGLTARLR